MGQSTSGNWLATSHETLANILAIIVCERGFSKQKCYQEPLACFIEVGHFGCFDASIIMRDRIEEFELEGSTWIKVQHEKLEHS